MRCHKRIIRLIGTEQLWCTQYCTRIRNRWSDLGWHSKIVQFDRLPISGSYQPCLSRITSDSSSFARIPNTTKNNILVIDVSSSRRKPSSGLTSGAGRQCVKACPIRGSTGSSPRLDSCCRFSWSILPPLWVCQLCLILDQSPWRSPSLSQYVVFGCIRVINIVFVSTWWNLSQNSFARFCR